MDPKNPLRLLIKDALCNNLGKNTSASFLVGLQEGNQKVTCILEDQLYQFPFQQSKREFDKMGKELHLKPAGDAWFDSSFRGRLDEFFKQQ